MSAITKEELEAFTQSNEKVATNLEKIATSLTSIVENQDKITTRLYNGLSKEITESFNKTCKDCKDTTGSCLSDIKKKQEDIKEDTRWIKISFSIFVSLCALAIIVMQVVHFFGGK